MVNARCIGLPTMVNDSIWGADEAINAKK